MASLSPAQTRALVIMSHSTERKVGWCSQDLADAGLETTSTRGLGMTLKGLQKRGLVDCVQLATARGNRRTRYKLTREGRSMASRIEDYERTPALRQDSAEN